MERSSILVIAAVLVVAGILSAAAVGAVPVPAPGNALSGQMTAGSWMAGMTDIELVSPAPVDGALNRTVTPPWR